MYIDNCTYTKCDGTGLCPACTHAKDMGVMCYNNAETPETTPAPAAATRVVYTAVLTEAGS